jgi:hypothetical protein
MYLNGKWYMLKPFQEWGEGRMKRKKQSKKKDINKKRKSNYPYLQMM